MFLFWLVIILLTIVALLFIIKPLLFYKTTSRAQEELQSQPSYLLSILLILGLPILAFCLYIYWGNSKVFSQWLLNQTRSEKIKQEIAKFGSRQKIIVALQEKLQQLPKDASSAKGWYLLGKLYFNEKKFPEAIQSFQTAVDLKPGDTEYLLDLISAKFYLNHKLSEPDKQIMNKLLSLSPNNINVINLLALDAYEQKNFEVAVRYWESMLKYFPQESEDSKMLLGMIRQAQNQIPQNVAINQKNISATINISKVLKNKLAINDTLFVYALDAHGPKMPLAVLRLRVGQFPVSVKLDNSTSMIPGKTLDNAKEIYVEARISKSGNALPEKGDLLGTSKIISLQSQNSKVDINIEKIYGFN